MPIKDYRFMTKTEISTIFPKLLSEYDVDSSAHEQQGFIIECDLEYPAHLHESHKTYPLAPENAEIEPHDLSPYQKKCHKVLNTKPSKVRKLVATFNNRKKYVVHAANLKLYLELGMILKKVHRVLTFVETDFLKVYIDFCTKMRSNSKNDFEKRLFKLMCNAVFGKFIENTSNYMDCKFCTKESQVKKWARSPRYKNYLIISSQLCAIFLQRRTTVCRQAYAIGFSILELSKEFMYSSYYKKIQPKLSDCSVLMSDTDSLFLGCSDKNPNKKLKKLLDTSNFKATNKLFRSDRKSKLGFFKSETGDHVIKKFIGLRSKCYAFRTEVEEKVIKCKGIAKPFRNGLKMETFQKCLDEISSFSTMQRTLTSKNHTIKIQKTNKLCFSSYDDKFYLLKCGVHTRPYGMRNFRGRLLNNDICYTCE